mgnify:CR=1 FL=1
MPQGRRGWLSTWVWASVEATTFEAPTGRSPGLGGASSDSMVFQASQLGHLPNQPELTAPQAWQTHYLSREVMYRMLAMDAFVLQPVA